MASAADFARRVLLVAAFALAPGAAFADATSVAEALFQEGRQLMKDGNYHAACAKLAESYRLDAAAGTLLNLASCHEHEGKTATAWGEFKDALAQATRDERKDRIKEASERIAALEPDLPRLRVMVSRDRPAGLEVELDGTRLGSASWDTRIPVDPGDHVVSARAKGYVAWTTHISAKPRQTEEIHVPALAAQPAPKTVLPPAAPPPERDRGVASGGPPAAAWILGGVGIAGVGVGSAFGLIARSKKQKSENECTGSTCTPEGANLLKDANRDAWISNAGFAVGIGGLAVATVLFVTAPPARKQRSSIRVGPTLGARTLGLDASGVW